MTQVVVHGSCQLVLEGDPVKPVYLAGPRTTHTDDLLAAIEAEALYRPSALAPAVAAKAAASASPKFWLRRLDSKAAIPVLNGSAT